jgi:hypothetical protein
MKFVLERPANKHPQRVTLFSAVFNRQNLNTIKKRLPGGDILFNWGGFINRRSRLQLQPPFGPSVGSLCHPCITTTHLSYSVLPLELPPPPCAVLVVHEYTCAHTQILYIYNIYHYIHTYIHMPIIVLNILYV